MDLEVGRRDHRIHAFGAVRADSGKHLIFRRGDLFAALDELHAFADGVEYLLGHNRIAFYLPHLQAVRPDLGLLQLPPIDTLCLNPLAFPRTRITGWSSTTRTASNGSQLTQERFRHSGSARPGDGFRVRARLA